MYISKLSSFDKTISKILTILRWYIPRQICKFTKVSIVSLSFKNICFQNFPSTRNLPPRISTVWNSISGLLLKLTITLQIRNTSVDFLNHSKCVFTTNIDYIYCRKQDRRISSIYDWFGLFLEESSDYKFLGGLLMYEITEIGKGNLLGLLLKTNAIF